MVPVPLSVVKLTLKALILKIKCNIGNRFHDNVMAKDLFTFHNNMIAFHDIIMYVIVL